MAHCLVVYGTTEGQARKIARHIAETIEMTGHSDELFDAAGGPLPEGFGAYDAIFVVASVHHGRYQAPVYQYVRGHADGLNAANSAFVSVSLAIMSKLEVEREEARAFPHAMFDATGWRPRAIHHAAGALRYSRYDFFKKWIMRRIARHEGGPADTSRDYEFTDWRALDRFVAETLMAPAQPQQEQAEGPLAR